MVGRGGVRQRPESGPDGPPDPPGGVLAQIRFRGYNHLGVPMKDGTLFVSRPSS